jgi:hypothetical protein
MLATAENTSVSHRRRCMHPTKLTYRVPVTHVSHRVSVPVRASIEEPPPKPPEWQTDVWKHRVEAEALHRLEHSLHGGMH